ncbi:MAG: 2,3-bisphosphoglycerate-independent phosphoglycerate mutase [Alphaproteobacteria bacterium]|nr:2,3-bisphosphoglycerate-independent phosphoglycerate mutase [Alphaproteobacteria bacterium]
MTKLLRRPVVLCVLDGFGHRAERADNAILLARTPNLDRFRAGHPPAFLEASERHVGLPKGQMGNSEVGHMNLGAGRVVMQDLVRIDAAIEDGSFAREAALAAFIAKLKASGGTAHLMGLLSPGGVHSMQDHIAALAAALSKAGVPVAVHAFLDGRDTPPRSAEGYLAKFEADIAPLAGVRLATAGGRYYAMDRDKRWERVEKAYRTLVAAEGARFAGWREGLAASYAADTNDEFVVPFVLGDYAGMREGDGLLMANFRADRAREILEALLVPDFKGFAREPVKFAATLGLVEYSAALAPYVPAIFAPQSLANMMGEIVAKAGLKQLRIAETEKYAHVTFFFNGGEEKEFPGERRILVPSPKVATYDLKPEMSAPEMTDKLVAAIEEDTFDFIVVNYANCDMVGHTGDLRAAIKAVETVDTCLGRVAAAVEAKGGAMLVTADHGNCECMRDPQSGQPMTAHTLNPVPVYLVGGRFPGRNAPVLLADGILADVAPTLLELMGLPQPPEMTGHSLLQAPAAAE